MKLDAEILRYLTKTDFRVLVAIELGMKNHELVPLPLIESLAKLRRHGLHEIISTLLKYKLIAHENKVYNGYKLTYLGYDYLALKVLLERGVINSVGMKMGVGKESDIHLCQNDSGETMCLKLHRLGRVSFKSIKNNRDYLQHRKSASWMYLARLAALKEFAYMRVLYDNGFNVPEPIDVNRHALVMGYIDSCPLHLVKTLRDPYDVLERLMCLIVRLARSGLIHCDFNEFNLMVSDLDNEITMIDFPQMVPITHSNAESYFERDVNCIIDLFRRKFGILVSESPSFKDVTQNVLSEYKITCSREKNFSDYCNLTQNEEKLLESAFVCNQTVLNDNNTNQEEDELNDVQIKIDKLSFGSQAEDETDKSSSENYLSQNDDNNIIDDSEEKNLHDTVKLLYLTTRRHNKKSASASIKAKKENSRGNCGVKKNKNDRLIKDCIKQRC